MQTAVSARPPEAVCTIRVVRGRVQGGDQFGILPDRGRAVKRGGVCGWWLACGGVRMLGWLRVVVEATGLIHIVYQQLECFSAPQYVPE